MLTTVEFRRDAGITLWAMKLSLPGTVGYPITLDESDRATKCISDDLIKNFLENPFLRDEAPKETKSETKPLEAEMA